MGGIGAGMICLEGAGALTRLGAQQSPTCTTSPMFAALGIKGRRLARVLEGPVPEWKIFTTPEAGNGLGARATAYHGSTRPPFQARFPFGTVAWPEPEHSPDRGDHRMEPFVPGDADSSSLPVAALELTVP